MSSGGATPDINVTPLIDVLLVLLIIFMVVAPTKPSQFETKVPAKPDPNQQNTPDNPLVTPIIEVTQPGKYILTSEDGKEELPPDRLEQKLTKLFTDRTEDDRVVIIKARTKLPYGEVVNVVDVAKGAKAKTIGLQVDALEEN
jgi:biopolymer transport protein ExbD